MEIEIFKSPGFMSTTDILNILNRDIFKEMVLTNQISSVKKRAEMREQ